MYTLEFKVVILFIKVHITLYIVTVQSSGKSHMRRIEIGTKSNILFCVWCCLVHKSHLYSLLLFMTQSIGGTMTVYFGCSVTTRNRITLIYDVRISYPLVT